MRSALVVGAAAIWLGAPPVLAGSLVGTAACRHRVGGRVLDADLGTPLEGVLVVVEDGSETARTGPDGRFELEGRCPGRLALVFSLPGFLSARREVEVPLDGSLEVDLRFPTQSLTVIAPAVDPLADLGFEAGLEGEALARTRGLGLADALGQTAGVQVLRSGAVAKPVIDGFTGNRILILNDGLRHHAQLWALDHAPEIDPFAAHRLTVIRGAEGVRYGADGIGGVIVIEPPPFLEPKRPGFRAEGNLVGISNGYQGLAHLSVLGTVPQLPRLGFRVQGSAKKAGTLTAPDYPLDNTGAEDLSGEAALRWQDDGFDASLGVSHLAQTYGIFTGIRAESPRDFRTIVDRGEPPEVDLYETGYAIDRAFTRVEHTYVRAEAGADLGFGELRALYGFQNDDRREFEITRVPTSGAQLRFLLESHALELTLEHALGSRLSGVLGVSGLLQLNDHQGRRLVPDYERRVGGIFLLERLAEETWSITAGLRYERQALDTEQPARINPSQNPPERFALDFEAVQASLGAALSPVSGLTLDVHLATATRIPTVDELFLDGLLPGEIWVVQGDPELRPERTFNLGLGVALEASWIGAEVVGFAHWIADYIYRRPVLEPDGSLGFRVTVSGRNPALAYENVDALQAGGTAEVDLHPVPWAHLRVRGSWVRGRDLDRGVPLYNLPADRYETRLGFRWPRLGPLERPEIHGEHVFVARRSDVDPSAELAPPPPAYHLVHAGLSGHFALGSSEVRLGVEVHNLLDTSYRDYLSRLRFFADEPGRSVIVRLGFALDAAGGEGTREN